MRYISLFSGIGGFDLGFERAGMICDSVCEIDIHAQNVLRRHFPGAKLFTDVKIIGKNTHETIDLICGGFPCQDVSIAGKRAGIAGERSGLWFEFARIIEELNPGWVVIENVPGLLSSNRGQDFAVIIQWLAQRGYGVVWRVLDAQYFGVAQRRRRVFIVASLGSGRAAEILFERESGAGNFEPRKKGKKNITGTVGSGVNDIVAPAIDASYYQKRYSDQQMFRQGGDAYPVAIAHSCANAEMAENMSTTLTCHHEAPILWEASHADEAVRIGAEISPTLQARMGTGGNQIPMVGLRRLTPVECERLQGFPDGWTDGQADTHRYKQLGNAVAVPVAEFIGRRIMEAK